MLVPKSLRTFLIARKVYKNYPIIVSQKVISTDLVELEMVDFDVILGIDLLHSYYDSVDCSTRIVRIQFQNEQILAWKFSILAPMVDSFLALSLKR